MSKMILGRELEARWQGRRTLNSHLLTSTPKLQLTAEQPSIKKKSLESTKKKKKKIFYIQRCTEEITRW